MTEPFHSLHHFIPYNKNKSQPSIHARCGVCVRTGILFCSLQHDTPSRTSLAMHSPHTILHGLPENTKSRFRHSGPECAQSGFLSYAHHPRPCPALREAPLPSSPRFFWLLNGPLKCTPPRGQSQEQLRRRRTGCGGNPVACPADEGLLQLGRILVEGDLLLSFITLPISFS